jgi:hypothetical protein
VAESPFRAGRRWCSPPSPPPREPHCRRHRDRRRRHRSPNRAGRANVGAAKVNRKPRRPDAVVGARIDVHPDEHRGGRSPRKEGGRAKVGVVRPGATLLPEQTTYCCRKPPICSGFSSPLTDSNRRPPPYHSALTRKPRVSAGHGDHENPANRTDQPTRIDRRRTCVVAPVFPQRSLAVTAGAFLLAMREFCTSVGAPGGSATFRRLGAR